MPTRHISLLVFSILDSFQSFVAYTSNSIHSLYPEGLAPPQYVHSIVVFLVLIMVPIALLALLVATPVTTMAVHRKTATTTYLPNPSTFQKENGTKWRIESVGNIQFTGKMGTQGLGGDKCRSSYLGGQHIWNCGDMMCGSSISTCGFNMGPAFYGTSNVQVINASAHSNIADFQFAGPWSGDPKPLSPQFAYGMDTSNIVALNDTTGIAYVWEITRGGAGSSFVDHGAGVVAVTLGVTKPIAARIGPLLTGPSSVQLGLLGIIRVGNYIYNYNQQGPTGNLIVGRVEASDAAFDASNYEYLAFSSSTSSKPKWVPGIPSAVGAAKYGMRSSDSGGRFNCQQYGSVFWNNYFEKYMLMCNLFMDFTFFYLADDPWGPWSEGYKLLNQSGYGVSAHPSYSPGGSDRELYFSQGPNGPFNTFKVTFEY